MFLCIALLFRPASGQQEDKKNPQHSKKAKKSESPPKPERSILSFFKSWYPHSLFSQCHVVTSVHRKVCVSKHLWFWFSTGIACWSECQTRDRKVASLNPGRSGGRTFFFRVNFYVLTLIRCPFHPMLLQWHVKDPGHSAKSGCGRLHLKSHTTLTQCIP